MDFSDPSFFRIYEAYLCGEDKGDVLRRDRNCLQIVVFRSYDVLQAEEAIPFGFQFIPDEKEPFGMCKVTGSKKAYAFYLGPIGKSVENHLTGGGPGKLGMDMKVSNKFHRG